MQLCQFNYVAVMFLFINQDLEKKTDTSILPYNIYVLKK